MNMTEIENRTRPYLRRLDTKLDSVMRDITELKQDRAPFDQQHLTPGLPGGYGAGERSYLRAASHGLVWLHQGTLPV